MRSFVIALLALALLPGLAHADTLDNFSVVGNGQDFEFSLPASTTGPDYNLSQGYNSGLVSGTLNGVPTALGVNIVFPSHLGVGSNTFTVGTASTYAELGLPSLYDLTFSPFAGTATLSFLPGTYSTFAVGGLIPVLATYTITITPQGTAVTPEPPSLMLVATAALGSVFVLRRRPLARS